MLLAADPTIRKRSHALDAALDAWRWMPGAGCLGRWMGRSHRYCSPTQRKLMVQDFPSVRAHSPSLLSMDRCLLSADGRCCTCVRVQAV